MEIIVDDDPALAAARAIAGHLRDAVGERGEAFVAVSGGSTAPGLFARLLELDVPWEQVTVWQVDERVAPDGHHDRNAEQLAPIPAVTHLMPVTAADLDLAADQYAHALPERFDVVHLGLGDDGHTASWPPGVDEVVDTDRLVAVTPGEFNGYRRMTLTPAVVNAAGARVLLTVGLAKAPLLRRWRDGDHTLPVAHVRHDGTTVFVDPSGDPSPG